MNSRYRRGWFGDSHRHYLAAKGISTKRYYASVVSRMAGTDKYGKEHKDEILKYKEFEEARKNMTSNEEDEGTKRYREIEREFSYNDSQAVKDEMSAQHSNKVVVRRDKGFGKQDLYSWPKPQRERNALDLLPKEIDRPDIVFTEEDVQKAGSKLSPEQARMFVTVARNQRGAPEAAWKALRTVHGGGHYDDDIMTAGDLIDRMTERPLYSDGGYYAVQEKVERLLENLYIRDRYEGGYRQKVKDQLNENAKYFEEEKGVPKEEYYKLVSDAQEKYVEAHKGIPAFNDAQKTAQRIAIAWGEERYEDAREDLIKLKNKLDEGQESWADYALEVPEGM